MPPPPPSPDARSAAHHEWALPLDVLLHHVLPPRASLRLLCRTLAQQLVPALRWRITPASLRVLRGIAPLIDDAVVCDSDPSPFADALAALTPAPLLHDVHGRAIEVDANARVRERCLLDAAWDDASSVWSVGFAHGLLALAPLRTRLELRISRMYRSRCCVPLHTALALRALHAPLVHVSGRPSAGLAVGFLALLDDAQRIEIAGKNCRCLPLGIDAVDDGGALQHLHSPLLTETTDAEAFAAGMAPLPVAPVPTREQLRWLQPSLAAAAAAAADTDAAASLQRFALDAPIAVPGAEWMTTTDFEPQPRERRARAARAALEIGEASGFDWGVTISPVLAVRQLYSGAQLLRVARGRAVLPALREIRVAGDFVLDEDLLMAASVTLRTLSVHGRGGTFSHARHLRQLADLRIVDRIDAPSDLGKCTSLTRLELPDLVGLSSSTLSKLVQLRTLRIANQKNLDDGVFVGLTALTDLSCRGCLVEPAAFAPLAQLRRLDAARCHSLRQYGSFHHPAHPFDGCAATLTALDCSFCDRIESGAFAQLGGLEHLVVTRCNSVYDDAFEQLTRLRTLVCNDVRQLADNAFASLRGLTALSCRNLDALRGTALSLPALRNLTALECSGCIKLPLRVLAQCTALTALSSETRPALNNATLARLKHLRVLNCSFADAATLTDGAFDGLTRLEALRCVGCAGLTDAAFADAAALARLHTLITSQVPGVRGTTLAALPALRTLVAHSCLGLAPPVPQQQQPPPPGHTAAGFSMFELLGEADLFAI